MPGSAQQLAVDLDMVVFKVRLRSQFRDHDAVDGYPAGGDQFLGLAAASHAGLGDDLLQARAGLGILWRGWYGIVSRLFQRARFCATQRVPLQAPFRTAERVRLGTLFAVALLSLLGTPCRSGRSWTP
jgi:hypothetical protein